MTETTTRLVASMNLSYKPRDALGLSLVRDDLKLVRRTYARCFTIALSLACIVRNDDELPTMYTFHLTVLKTHTRNVYALPEVNTRQTRMSVMTLT